MTASPSSSAGAAATFDFLANLPLLLYQNAPQAREGHGLA